MRIVFMGTPIFATGILKRLLSEGYHVVGVVTQPDKKVGRKQTILATPVKQFAIENHIAVFQPIKIREDYETIKEWHPDLIITCAYGQMIPEHILNTPSFGSLNVHASLLPKLRGGAPIHKAIIYGYEKTGVSIMRMIRQMDAGDYMLQGEVVIEEDDTTQVLHDKLMECGADLIAKAIPLLIAGKAVFVKQKEEEATFAYNITKEEECIDMTKGTKEVYNQIRGLISWPVGYIIVSDKKIKIHAAQIGNSNTKHSNGKLFVENKRLFLQCSDGTIELLEVQLEGKAKISASAFINGAGRSLI